MSKMHIHITTTNLADRSDYGNSIPTHRCWSKSGVMTRLRTELRGDWLDYYNYRNFTLQFSP